MAEPRPTPSLLEVRRLSVSLGRGRDRREVLHEVSFQVDAGEIVGIIGESGSGKTTLARTTVGIHKPDAGRILFEGAEVGADAAALRRFRRRGALQYVFQDPLLSLNPDRPVIWSVGEPLAVRGVHDAAEVDRALELALLDRDLAHRLPQHLSGGQRQRALIARAIVTRPKLIFADEPVSALDAGVRVQILDLLRRLAREQGIGIAFISHDIGSVAGIADRIVVLYRGQVVEDGASEQVVRAPRHPYTRLLIGSTPSLNGQAMGREARQALKALI